MYYLYNAAIRNSRSAYGVYTENTMSESNRDSPLKAISDYLEGNYWTTTNPIPGTTPPEYKLLPPMLYLQLDSGQFHPYAYIVAEFKTLPTISEFIANYPELLL